MYRILCIICIYFLTFNGYETTEKCGVSICGQATTTTELVTIEKDWIHDLDVFRFDSLF